MIYITKNNFSRFIYFSIFCMLMHACGEDPIYGCTDSIGCNYNVDATEDDGSCTYSETYYDCDGNCLNDVDLDGICDEYEVGGCTDISACNYNENAIEDDDSCTYCLDINFNHVVDGSEIVFGNENIIYQNNASNMYSVRRILYVLSDVILYFDNGSLLELEDFIFINTDDPETLNYSLNDLPALCSGISFRIGFSSEKNIDNAYINAENNFHNNMVWPNLNGTDLAFQGGYHYMKLEGKYLDLVDGEYFYNTHTGPTNAEDFSVLYSQFEFDPSSIISINMNVNNWYNDPIYNMVIFGNAIMGNSDAQELLYQNGQDVFFIEIE